MRNCKMRVSRFPGELFVIRVGLNSADFSTFCLPNTNEIQKEQIWATFLFIFEQYPDYTTHGSVRLTVVRNAYHYTYFAYGPVPRPVPRLHFYASYAASSRGFHMICYGECLIITLILLCENITVFTKVNGNTHCQVSVLMVSFA